MSFNVTYSACQSPQGLQPILNVLRHNPVFHCWSGDYVYNDSLSVYNYNGYTMNPSVYWETPDGGAPENANTAARTILRFEKHYGRTGLSDYSKFWQIVDKGGLKCYFQPDDHDHKCNNWDHSLLAAQAGFPMPGFDGGTGLDNSIYGQIKAVTSLSKALAYIWDIGVSGFTQFKSQYGHNPVSPGYNGDVPSAMVGTATFRNYPIEYFYKDVGFNGEDGIPAVRFIFPDSISYKNPAIEADSVTKQFWGQAQEEWLFQTALALKNAGGVMNVFISTKDLYNLDNNDGPWTYSARRDALLTRLHNADIPHIWITGDKHVPHAGMARTAAGKAYDALAVCACPAGQGIGNLTQYTENIYAASYNDQCVYGLINVDDVQRVVNVSIMDFFSGTSVFTASVPFGSRVPSNVYTKPHPAFVATPNPNRGTISVPASGTAQQNDSIRTRIYNIVGGTFSGNGLEVSDDDTTYDSLGLNARQVIVRSGNFFRINYSAAPTAISYYDLPV